jgi:hypothetical protein
MSIPLIFNFTLKGVKMKKSLAFSIFFLAQLLVLASCGDESNDQIIDQSQPQGNYSALRSGVLTAQNSTPTAGNVEIGVDGENSVFVHFTSNFTTSLATGTVVVYLSKSQTLQLDPANGNPNSRLIGIIQANGEQYHKINVATDDASFTHVILWCASAGIPFGYAGLQ